MSPKLLTPEAHEAKNKAAATYSIGTPKTRGGGVRSTTNSAWDLPALCISFIPRGRQSVSGCRGVLVVVWVVLVVGARAYQRATSAYRKPAR